MASSHDFRIKKLRPRKDQPNMVWIVYKMTDEWYNEWQQVLQRVTTLNLKENPEEKRDIELRAEEKIRKNINNTRIRETVVCGFSWK